jgi:hypothetical protein
MANIDMTREINFAQKKGVCLFASELVEGTASYEIPAASGNYLLANIPTDAIITDAYIQVRVAADAATSSSAKLGTAEGGSQVLSAANLKTVGKQGTFTGHVVTGTGAALYLGVTVSGAATNVGEYVVVVEYVEYRKNTGEYTRITN